MVYDMCRDWVSFSNEINTTETLYDFLLLVFHDKYDKMIQHLYTYSVYTQVPTKTLDEFLKKWMPTMTSKSGKQYNLQIVIPTRKPSRIVFLE